MSGFGAVKDRMSPEAYYDGLVAGRINDPTLSMQRKVGFEFRGLLKNYLQDPVCDNYSVLIVLDAATEVAGAVRPSRRRSEGETPMASIQLKTEVPGPKSKAVLARRAFSRVSLEGPVVRALPALSAVVILLVGVALTVRALPGVV